MDLSDITRGEPPCVLGVAGIYVDFTGQTKPQQIESLRIPLGVSTQLTEAEMKRLRGALEKSGVELIRKSGGSVPNTLDTLCRLELTRPALVGIGAQDENGRFFAEECSQHGIPLLSPLREGETTGTTICLVSKKGTSSIIWTPGASGLLSAEDVEQGILRYVENERLKLDLIIIDSFTFGFGQSGVVAAVKAAQLAQRYETPYILTLASEEIIERYHPIIQELARSAWLTVGNQAQVIKFFQARTDLTLKSLIPTIRKSQFSGVLMTRGAKGAWCRLQGEEAYTEKLPSLQAIDTCGAGDAFLAGFLTMWHYSADLQSSLDFANALARKNVEFAGARFPSEFDFGQFIEENFYRLEDRREERIAAFDARKQ